MKRELRTNGLIHDCKVCAHRKYCGHDEDTLLKNADSTWGKHHVPIPDTCPIPKNPCKQVKVVFT